jgi:hypothetical protein
MTKKTVFDNIICRCQVGKRELEREVSDRDDQIREMTSELESLRSKTTDLELAISDKDRQVSGL